MRVYTYIPEKLEDDARLFLTERDIYGSSRIGVEQVNQVVASGPDPGFININEENGIYNGVFNQYVQTIGDRRYELSNHLGNVLEVLTDRKLQIDENTYDPITGVFVSATADGVVDYYVADVVSQSDYYPFGMLLPNQNESTPEYRYGFNGMESDDEVTGDKGTSYDFGARFYNPRVGRWLSVDPQQNKYPDLAPYSFVGNMVTIAIDPDGEKIIVVLEDGSEVEYVPGIQPINNSEFLQNVHEAVSYVMKNDVSNTFQDLSSNPNTVKLVYSDSFEGSEGAETTGTIKSASDGSIVQVNAEIQWNPKAALETTSGGGLAPSTTLLHEADHANEILNIKAKADLDNYKKDHQSDGTVYDSPEEFRVIEGVEKNYVNAVNKDEAMMDMVNDKPQQQADRNDHRGSLYESVGVNSITPEKSSSVVGQPAAVAGQAVAKKSMIIPVANDNIPAPPTQ